MVAIGGVFDGTGQSQLARADNNDVRRAYLRGEHWNERVRMMQFWSDYLDKHKRTGNRTTTVRYGNLH